MGEEENNAQQAIPLFNKNAFASNGTVVITTAARMVMDRNRRLRQPHSSSGHRLVSGDTHIGVSEVHELNVGDSKPRASTINDAEVHQLTKAELHAMRCVVDGLRLIHRDKSHIKEVLSHCITEESFGPNEYVRKKKWEQRLSCHFIVSGSVMVTYEVDKDEMEKGSDTTEIVYTHGAGEYLAMLSLEGIEDDIAPPSTVLTLEPTEFLRLDRVDFHQRLDRMVSKLGQEIRETLQHPDCILSAVPDEAMERILPHITRQQYPPQNVILKQGEDSNVMFCIARGRCELTRMVHVPEARKNVCFSMGFVLRYGCFGQECLLQSSPSLCTATTTCSTLVIKINRQALQVVIKDHLHAILDRHFQGYTSDQDLKQTGYHACVWNEFKHSQVKQHLVEVGAPELLLPHTSSGIHKKPMSPKECYKENLRRFILHGANFEPVTRRIRSAYIRRPGRVVFSAPDGMKPRHKSAGSSQRTGSAQSRSMASASSTRTNSSISRPTSSSLKNGDHAESDETDSHEQDILRNNGDVFVSKIYTRDNNTLLRESPVPNQSQLPDSMHVNSNFMRAAVMVTLTTKDIVKKAKAAAKKKGLEAPSDGRRKSGDDGRWYTSIHEEHDRLASDITRDKLRTAYIRKYLDACAKQRHGGVIDDSRDNSNADTNTNHNENDSYVHANNSNADNFSHLDANVTFHVEKYSSNTIVHSGANTTTQLLTESEEKRDLLCKQKLPEQKKDNAENSLSCRTVNSDGDWRTVNSFHERLKSQTPEENTGRFTSSASPHSMSTQASPHSMSTQNIKTKQLVGVTLSSIREEIRLASKSESNPSLKNPKTNASQNEMSTTHRLTSQSKNVKNTLTSPSVGNFTHGFRGHGLDPSCNSIQLRPTSAPALLPTSNNKSGRDNDEVTIRTLQLLNN